MDELFGKFFYLIPIALVLFRVIAGVAGSAAKKKREEEKAAQKKAAPAPVAKKAPAPSRPHWEESPKPVPQKPKTAAKPALPKLAAQKPAAKKPAPKIVPQMPQPAPAPASGGGGGAAQTAPVSRGLSAESAPPLPLANLPPLQAAFAWSEIFGAPLGLR